MEIKTKSFHITKGEFFKIRITEGFKMYWWLIILLSLVFGILEGSLGAIISIFFISLLVLIIGSWIFVHSKKNRIIFMDRTLQINDNFLIVKIEDGTETKLNLINIFKVTKALKYYLLYITKEGSLYLPRFAFLSENDIRRGQTPKRDRAII